MGPGRRGGAILYRVVREGLSDKIRPGMRKQHKSYLGKNISCVREQQVQVHRTCSKKARYLG